jgi:hypothetical protein
MASIRSSLAAAGAFRPAVARGLHARYWSIWGLTSAVVLACGASAGVLAYLHAVSDPGVLRERLEVVWPDLMQLPDADRRFLTQLATQCGLERRMKELGPVIQCLHLASQTAPRPAAAAEELRRLLNSAQMSWGG